MFSQDLGEVYNTNLGAETYLNKTTERTFQNKIGTYEVRFFHKLKNSQKLSHNPCK